MFAKFFIVLGMIFTAGPGHLEGGYEAVKEKGPKAALEQAWDVREPLDYAKMND